MMIKVSKSSCVFFGYGSLGELEKAVEILACDLCLHGIYRPPLPNSVPQRLANGWIMSSRFLSRNS